jgi:ABC-type lipoprotein release transport system permease subunit
VDDGAPRATIYITLPALIAAVDPRAEDQLQALGGAVVSGRPLQPGEGPGHNGPSAAVPVLASTTAPVDATVSAVVRRVEPPASGRLTDLFTADDVVRAVLDRPTTVVGQIPATDVAQVYRQAAGTGPDSFHGVRARWTTGQGTSQRLPGGALQPDAVRVPRGAFEDPYFPGRAPVGSDDTAFRQVRPLPFEDSSHVAPPSVHVVGTFDPARLAGGTAARPDPSGLAAETYAVPVLAPGDAASRQALGGRTLLPSLGMAGYPAQPPLLITTLDGMGPLSAQYGPNDPDKPISVVRVRVAGITGPDAVSRERLRQAAQAIQARTGLAVDVVSGASGIPQTVLLPAGRFGRPALTLQETWAKQGVATAVLTAVDRKSLVLFVLVLVVCALFVANATSAAVRTRREELGVLSCLGWRPSALFGALSGELAVLGLAAGLAGAALSLPVASAVGSAVDLRRALLAVPAAVVLTLLAGLPPVVRAARALPLDAVTPAVLRPRRAGWAGTVTGMALGAARRRPGRTLLAVLSLALGVAALAMLLAVDQAFRGAVVGSVLGDAVALQVRGPDVVAVLLVVLLGAVAVADVLYLGVREHAAEYATLLAAGWRGAHLARLVLVEALALAAGGAVVGAGAGLLGVWRFSGAPLGSLVPAVALAAAAGCVLTCVAAAVPAASILRLPAAALLANE